MYCLRTKMETKKCNVETESCVQADDNLKKGLVFDGTKEW